MTKDLLKIQDLDKDTIEEIFLTTDAIKEKWKRKENYSPLKGKTVGLLFKKPSTRTRISFEVGILQLGGFSLFLNQAELQMDRGEEIKDSAKILSKYLEGLIIRTFSQEEIEEFAKYAAIPVINGLTDLYHPCQILSDLYTIKKSLGRIEGIKLIYLGDSNNIAHTWLFAAAIMGITLTICSPSLYQPDPLLIREADKLKGENNYSLKIITAPQEAVKDADLIYTDVWISMGQEKETKRRENVFRPYQLNRELLKNAPKNALIMHCLPAHRGQEITAEVLESEQSIVYQQAENRLHVQKAILERLLIR